MSTCCLAAAQLRTSANSHSEELPPACCHFPELSGSGAGGRGSLKKALQMPASIQHSKVLCHGRVTVLAFSLTAGTGQWRVQIGVFQQMKHDFYFHLMKGGVLITTEVLQAQREKSLHPAMLHCYPKANGFVCSLWP